MIFVIYVSSLLTLSHTALTNCSTENENPEDFSLP